MNVLSGSRLILSPAFLYCVLDNSMVLQRLSFSLLVVILLTDVLDGTLARRWHVTSAFGYVADGIGDRALYVALLLAIAVLFPVHPVLCYILILRDLILYAARAIAPGWAATREDTRLSSKGTAIGMRVVCLGFLVLHYLRVLGHPVPGEPKLVGWFTMGLGAFGVLYVISLWRLLRKYHLDLRDEFRDRAHDDGDDRA